MDIGSQKTTATAHSKVEKQQKQLKRANAIIVGTPGRLIDHLKRKRLDLSKLSYVVLDEADEMLTMGFKDDLEYILKASSSERQTLLFSATMTTKVIGVTKKYMNNS